MAENKLEFKIVVTDNGTTKLVIKGLDNLEGALGRTTRAKNEASKATGELNYRLNQGVAGTSSAAKSFSKLSQSIGNGPNGLVGAYATLAANTFAVVAAFNALREAAAVEQVLAGIEFQGAKTGRTLSIVAKDVKELTGAAISSADALRATAQVSAAGFGSKEIKQLTIVARDAALALGRNIPDAMERITRGVTKLEPELLDELGLMTKLTEASAAYALQNNKTAAGLSSFEKRQAFLNAIVAEGTLKFAGIGEEIGVNPYDKLGASFKDLTKDILNGINVIGKFVALIMSNSNWVLTGALLLFASTIRSQLLPALAQSGVASRKRTLVLLEEAEATKKAALANIEKAKTDRMGALTSAREKLNINENSPAKFKAIADALKQGQIEGKALDKEINRIGASIRAHETQFQNGVYGRGRSAEDKRAIITGLEEQKKALQGIKTLEEEYKKQSVKNNEDIQKANKVTVAARMRAYAESKAADAIEAASKFKLVTAWNALTTSVNAYSRALALARANEAAAGAEITRTRKIADSARVGMFALVNGLRVAGTALINAIPQIGMFVLAVGLAIEGYRALFETDADKKRRKALQNFNETVDHTNQKLKELQRTNTTLASLASVTTQKLILQANAVTELADKATEAMREFINEAEKEKNQASLWKAIIGDEKDLASYTTGIAKNSKFLEPFEAQAKQAGALGAKDLLNPLIAGSTIAGRAGSIIGTMFDTTRTKQAAFAKGTEQLTKIMDEDLVHSLVETYGGLEAIAKSPALQEQFIKKAGQLYQGLANNVQELQEAFKQAETASTDFIRGISQSTSYDSILRSFQAVNNSINALMTSTTVNNNDFVGALAGVGSNTQKLLEPAIQKQLEQLRLNFQIRQSLIAQSKTELGLTEIQKNRLAVAQQQLDAAGKQRMVFVQAFRAAEDQLGVLQNQERLLKGQQQILRTHISFYEKIYSTGAAGVKARIKLEERTLDLQDAQTKAQIALQRTILSAASARLEELKAMRLMSEENANLHKIELERHKTTLEGLIASRQARLIENETNKTKRTQILQEDETLTMLRNAQDVTSTTLETINKQVTARAEIRAQEIAIRDITASISALQDNLANSAAQRLSEEEKVAAAAAAELKIRQDITEAYNKNAKAARSLEVSQVKIADMLSGASTDPLYSLKDVLNTAREQIIDINNDAKRDLDTITQSINELEAAQNSARKKGLTETADAAQAQILVQRDLLESRKLERDLAVANVQSTERLAILEKSIINIRKEGLDIQKQGLDVLTAYFNQREKQVDQEQEIYTLTAKVAAIRRGGALTEREEKALEIRALTKQIELAEEQVNLRKVGIDLEYGLLEAQRQLLVFELTTKKKILQAEASRLSDNDPAKQNLMTMADQMAATLANISAKSYLPLAEMAKQAEDRSIDILRLRREVAQGELANIGRITTPFDKMSEGLANAMAVFSGIISGKDRKTAPAKVEPAVIASNNLAEITTANTTAITALNGSVHDLIERLEATRPKEIAQTIRNTTGIRDTRSMEQTMKYAMDLAVKMGARNGGFELGATAGHKGRGHREGRAIDVNFAPGAGEQRGKARELADKAAVSFAEKGFVVLWNKLRYELGKDGVLRTSAIPANQNQHLDHLHVEAKQAGVIMGETVVATVVRNLPKERPSFAEAFKDIGTPSAAVATANPGETPETVTGKILEGKKTVEEANEQIKISLADTWRAASAYMSVYLEDLANLSPSGAALVAVIQGIDTMTSAMQNFSKSVSENGLSITNVAALASAALSVIQSVTSAASNARIANIEREIKAEEKRDGKSAASVSKIDAMEKKKDAIAKKQFNTNKKLMMAQAVINTAAGVTNALAWLPPPYSFIMAGLIGAMGAAQLAIISGTQYESSYSPKSVETPSSMSIGKRGDSVNLANGPSANAGGEIGYLRGSSGVGSNASDYRTIGSAYGGMLGRGYGSRGFALGEKGPEVLEADTPITVRPADEALGQAPITASISIQALDARGVEDILLNQRGNVIKMLRDAANANGERFMENVDVNVYTSPSVNRL